MASNSSEVISSILDKIGVAVNALTQVFTLASALILIVFIAVALIAVDSTVALIAISSFSMCYGLIYWFFRSHLSRNSKTFAGRGTHVAKALQEGMGGVSDVLLDGS